MTPRQALKLSQNAVITRLMAIPDLAYYNATSRAKGVIEKLYNLVRQI